MAATTSIKYRRRTIAGANFLKRKQWQIDVSMKYVFRQMINVNAYYNHAACVGHYLVQETAGSLDDTILLFHFGKKVQTFLVCTRRNKGKKKKRQKVTEHNRRRSGKGVIDQQRYQTNTNEWAMRWGRLEYSLSQSSATNVPARPCHAVMYHSGYPLTVNLYVTY